MFEWLFGRRLCDAPDDIRRRGRALVFGASASVKTSVEIEQDKESEESDGDEEEEDSG